MRLSSVKAFVLALAILFQSSCDRSPYVFEGIYAPDRSCSINFDRSGEKKTITVTPAEAMDIVYVSRRSKFVTSTDKYWLWIDKTDGGGQLTLNLQSKDQGKYSEEIGLIGHKDLEEVFSQCPFMRQKILLEKPSL